MNGGLNYRFTLTGNGQRDSLHREETMATEINNLHIREHTSLLADVEKRTLVWIARRLPGWVTSDHLSLLGLGSMLLAGLSFWAASWSNLALALVVVFLATNWFGDSLDGTLARVRNRQRPRYGFYVDHVIDLFGVLFLLGGLSLSGYMNTIVALGMLAAYLMVTSEVFLATHVGGVFRLSFMKFGPTELRILLAIGTLVLFYRPWVYLGPYGPFRLFDVGGGIACAGMMLTVVISAIRNTVALYRAEPLPR
jgi:archaetidylinositol phosphate synthase